MKQIIVLLAFSYTTMALRCLLFRLLCMTVHGLGSVIPMHLLQSSKLGLVEQPWPSCNALDSDQHGPGFEAQHRPLLTSGKAFGPKCSCQN